MEDPPRYLERSLSALAIPIPRCLRGGSSSDRPLLADSVLSIIVSGWFQGNTYTGIKYLPILPENGFCLNDFSIKSFNSGTLNSLSLADVTHLRFLSFSLFGSFF